MNFEQFVLNPATLLVLIFGLVEYLKSFGLKGNALKISSLLIGAGLAILYRLRDFVPALNPWVEIASFGLVAGLAASGIYDFLKPRFPASPN